MAHVPLFSSDDELGDFESGGDVAGARVVAEEIARFVDKGEEIFKRRKWGEEGGLKSLLAYPMGDFAEFLFGPIPFWIAAGRVDGDPLRVAPVDESWRRAEAVVGGGLDLEEDL